MTEIERLTADLKAASESAGELEATKQRLEAMDAVISNQVKATMKRLNVPKWAVSLLKKQTAVEQLSFLNEHADEFKKITPNFNGRDGGKTQGLGVGDDERKRIASAYGVREEFYK